MGTKQLTLTQKVKFTPIIIERDYPNGQEHICLYCTQPFIKDDLEWDREWEHLDGNRDNNVFENLAWVHRRCNLLKEQKLDWQYLASDKKVWNENWSGGSLGGSVSKEAKTVHTQVQPNEQIDANADAAKIAELYLTERLLPQNGRPPIDAKLDFNDAVEIISFRCFKKHGHGSQTTLGRIVKMITCTESDFARVEEDGRVWILRRSGN